MASTFERLVQRIQNERDGRSLGALSSTLIQQLREELGGYIPPEPNSFAYYLRLRLSRISEEFRLDRETRERNAALLAPYRDIEAKLSRELEAVTPFGVDPQKAVEQTAQVTSQLAAVRHLIGLFPDLGEAPEFTAVSEAVRAAREESVSKLRAWRDRLRREWLRLRDEVNALGPEEARALLSSFTSPRPALWDDVAAVVIALETAQDNLSTVR